MTEFRRYGMMGMRSCCAERVRLEESGGSSVEIFFAERVRSKKKAREGVSKFVS